MEETRERPETHKPYQTQKRHSASTRIFLPKQVTWPNPKSRNRDVLCHGELTRKRGGRAGGEDLRPDRSKRYQLIPACLTLSCFSTGTPRSQDPSVPGRLGPASIQCTLSQMEGKSCVVWELVTFYICSPFSSIITLDTNSQ